MPIEDAAASWLRGEDAGGVRILVHLQPGARRTGVAGEFNGRLKIAVAAPPAEGRANAALVDWLATRLGLPRHRVLLTAGTQSRDKTLLVEGVLAADVLRALKSP